MPSRISGVVSSRHDTGTGSTARAPTAKVKPIDESSAAADEQGRRPEVEREEAEARRGERRSSTLASPFWCAKRRDPEERRPGEEPGARL